MQFFFWFHILKIIIFCWIKLLSVKVASSCLPTLYMIHIDNIHERLSIKLQWITLVTFKLKLKIRTDENTTSTINTYHVWFTNHITDYLLVLYFHIITRHEKSEKTFANSFLGWKISAKVCDSWLFQIYEKKSDFRCSSLNIICLDKCVIWMD